VVLCHSFVRCEEISETIKEVTAFCSEIVEVIELDTSDLAEVNLKLKKSIANSTPLKSRLVILTPSLAVKMQEKNLFNSLGTCHSLVIDKIDLLQALDFGSDLLKLNIFKPSYRCIFTNTD
jgi:molybdenum cofactor biosynthesis enzyme